MKFILLLLFIFPFIIFGQDEAALPIFMPPVDTVFYSNDKEVGDSVVYLFPTEEAQFPGGNISLLSFISNNIVYPTGYESIDVVGRIYLEFIINKDGQISNVKIKRGIDKNLDDMAIELIQKMPNWIPAKNYDVTVRSLIRLPIQICFD